MELLNSVSDNPVSLFVTILVILLGGLIFVRFYNVHRVPSADSYTGSQASNIDRIVFCGLSGSGKTTLFHLLKSKSIKEHQKPKTTPSARPNFYTFQPNSASGNSIELIDFPGHAKLHPELDSKYAPSSKFVIFVLDSQSPAFLGSSSLIAEYIYDLLSKYRDSRSAKNTSNKKPFILVACHKQDCVLSYKPNVIKPMLMKDLKRAVKIKSSSTNLDTLDSSSLPASNLNSDSWLAFGSLKISELIFGKKQAKIQTFDQPLNELKHKIPSQTSSTTSNPSLSDIEEFISNNLEFVGSSYKDIENIKNRIF